MPNPLRHLALAAALSLSCGAAFAWGAEGHRTVGAIADRLLTGTHAAAEVATLLDGISLQDASVWADCARGIDPAKDFAYTSGGRFPECKPFETPAGEAELADFVRRNDTNCARQAGDESCHKAYHYTDEAIQRSKYVLGKVGTREFDVVAAITAAIHVLKGEPAPPPFDIKDKRQALLMLAHYVGDIHQPQHVGSIYLDADGAVVDPDATTFDPATANRGGNDILTIRKATNRRTANFHQTWDDVPESLGATHLDAAWLKRARAVRSSTGDAYGWSTAWATETLLLARKSLHGLVFSAKQANQWTTTLPYAYDPGMEAVKKQQLTAAGARLAQVLKTVWP